MRGGEGGPCSLELPGWPGLGKRLVLTSDLPALTHRVPAQVGPAQGDAVWEAAISGELILHGMITSKKGFILRAKVKSWKHICRCSTFSHRLFPWMWVGGGKVYTSFFPPEQQLTV